MLIPLLGVTWLFGALSSTHKAFAYIFVIFNSTQVRCEPPSLRMHYSSIGKLTVGAAVFAIRHLHNSDKVSGKVHMKICQKSFLQPKKSWIMIGKISLHLVCGSHPFFSLKSKHLITNWSQEIKRRYGKARNYFTEDGQGLYKYILWKTLVTVFLIFLPAGIFHLSSSLCEK